MLEINTYRNICDSIYERLQELALFNSVVTADYLGKIKGLLSLMSFDQLQHTLEKEPTVLKDLASKSYIHENGFYKLTVIDKPNAKFKIRLHFWPASSIKPAQLENIHNHRFNYYSYILKGSLLNRIWKVASSGAKFRHYLYNPRMRKQAYVLDYCGDAFLEASEERQYSNGDLYCMNAEDLHTASVPHNTDVVTLFIEERSNLRLHADVFSNDYNSRNVPIASPSLTVSQYLEVLSIISSALKNENYVVSEQSTSTERISIDSYS